MCEFLSAIVTRSGEIFWDLLTDSHTDLMGLFGIRENNVVGPECQNFARVEFSPSRGDLFDLDSYKLFIDETVTPSWFDGELKEKVSKKLRKVVEGMIVVDGSRPVRSGGGWLIGEGGRLTRLISGRIVGVHPKANLSNGNLYGANLYGTNLSGANLSRANLSNGNLSNGNLYGANLSSANLSYANLPYANLPNANLSVANLSVANLSVANLYYANLSGANLSGANLSVANLYYANLSGANLYDANLFDANLTNCLWNPDYPIPMGWKIGKDNRLERSA